MDYESEARDCLKDAGATPVEGENADAFRAALMGIGYALLEVAEAIRRAQA